MKKAVAIVLVNSLAIAALGLAATSGFAPAKDRDAASPPKSSAAPAKPQPRELSPDYLPLSRGSRWEYDVTIDLPLVGAKQAGAVTQVEGLYEIDGKTYCKTVMQVHGAPVNPKNVAYFRPTKKGVFQILEGEEKQGEWLYLPRELKVGQKWNAATTSSKFAFEVTARGDVDCFGKIYKDCIQITIDMQTKFGSIKQEQWLAPGVGPVKQVDHHTLFDSTAVLKKLVVDEPKGAKPN